VSVLVIDCTTTGASLPTLTPFIEPVTDFLRRISAMGKLYFNMERAVSQLSALSYQQVMDAE
jgi:hypothetical protein